MADMLLDSGLIERVCKGDRTAIGALFERYHTGIFRYLYYKVGDQHTAEDLTSEVFLRFIRSIDDSHPENMQPQAWLYKAARNLAIDHYRKNQTQKPIDLPETLSAEHAVADHVEKGLESQELYKAINQLPFEQREVIILRFINSLPIAEAAHVMGRTEDAVKGLQHRALQALRQSLIDMGFTH